MTPSPQTLTHQLHVGPPHIDLDTFNDMCEIMEEEMRDLVDTFLADAPRLLEGMGRAIVAGDTEALINPAHSLKSTTASLGLMRLSGYARELEKKGRHTDKDGVDDLFAQATAAWKVVQEELPRLMYEN
ncbi:MAG: Hpt domain-containing protein [Pseudomonadota bacterium]|nr:Hpt domain-containing protein [Pseudomonadota bacterium]